ncbi:MAG: carboxymuconolactone decarboxylase family protein [Pseudomonadota bacterium]
MKIEPTIHTVDTAPDASKPLLEDSQRAYGMVPNLHAVMAASPAHLEGYKALHALVVEKTAFTPAERTVVWMAINVEHVCHYCVPAHTTIAKGESIDEAVIEALRNATPLADPKLEALRRFALAVVRERGTVSKAEIDAFKAAGFEDAHILDVLLILAQKVMSNYANHIFETPVDAPFAKNGWDPKSAGKAA